MSYLQASLGIIIFPLLAWLISENRKQVSLKLIVSALGLQVFLGMIFLHVPVIQKVFFIFNDLVLSLNTASKDGASFIFGYLGGGETPFTVVNPANNFIIAFQVLPVIIVVSALSALLYHWGILQKIIGFFSWTLSKALKTDGPTTMGVASSIFLGIIESPIFVKPYLSSISRSGLFTIITAGMATVAGTVMVLYASVLSATIPNAAAQILIASIMSAPAAIMFAKIIIPSSEDFTPSQDIAPKIEKTTAFEAIIKGTEEGVRMVAGIIGILIVLFAFVSLINMIIGLVPFSEPLTIQKIIGYAFIPLVWLMGIESHELLAAGQLMGTKLLLNELVAYTQLSSNIAGDKSRLIMTYALCGFANFGSLGILIGGLGPIIPNRKKELVSLSLKALIAGTLATMTTGAVIGLISF